VNGLRVRVPGRSRLIVYGDGFIFQGTHVMIFRV
jgi:hypothetical protein